MNATVNHVNVVLSKDVRYDKNGKDYKFLDLMDRENCDKFRFFLYSYKDLPPIDSDTFYDVDISFNRGNKGNYINFVAIRECDE